MNHVSSVPMYIEANRRKLIRRALEDKFCSMLENVRNGGEEKDLLAMAKLIDENGGDSEALRRYYAGEPA
jgi:hypothetical protein